MLVAIDFDGMITVGDRYPNTATVDPDCKPVMDRLSAWGVRFILNTCREGAELGEAIIVCEAEQLPIIAFNKNDPMRVSFYGSDCRKLGADVYLDDKNAGGRMGWLEFEKWMMDTYFNGGGRE